jgi:hypothetical protein
MTRRSIGLTLAAIAAALAVEAAAAPRQEPARPPPPGAGQPARGGGDGGPTGQTEDEVYIGKAKRGAAPKAGTTKAKPRRTGDNDDTADLEVQRKKAR